MVAFSIVLTTAAITNSEYGMLLSSADSLNQPSIVGNSFRQRSLPQAFITLTLLGQSHPSGCGINQVMMLCNVDPGPSLLSFIPARLRVTSFNS